MATKAKTASAVSLAPKFPKFDQLVGELSDADNKARSKAADATQARGERSAIAVSTIAAAFHEGIEPENVRATLLEAGVLKGTVSKIVTVIAALNTKLISLSEVDSLNGAYSLIKRIEGSYATAVAAAIAETSYETVEGPAEPKYATTPEQALEVILESIKGLSSADEKFKVGGEWLTRFTNAISTIMKEIGDDE